MIKYIEGKEKAFFGKIKATGECVYMTKPSFDCQWFWSFGYLGNEDCHYHLSSYQDKSHFFTLKDDCFKSITERRNKSMHDCLLEDYELSDNIKDNLWSFCEQASTIYTLKKVAEIFHRGGSNNTTHPQKDVIKGFDDNKINSELLPVLLQTFWDQFGK